MITMKELKEQVKDKPAVVIFFWKQDHNGCSIAARSVSGVMKVHKDVHFIKIDCEQEPEIMTGCRIKELPAFLLTRNGRYYSKMTGVPSVKILNASIELLLKWKPKTNKRNRWAKGQKQ